MLVIISLIIGIGPLKAQQTDTLELFYARSRGDTVIYTRIIGFGNGKSRFHVRDYFDNGQIQMDANYSSFDPNIKEEIQCNYISNTKTGRYTEWYKNGRIKYTGNYKNGLRNGRFTSWYDTGIKEAEENWSNGKLHGRVRYWTSQGDLQFDLSFDHGLNRHPENVSYQYLAYTPPGYDQDTLKEWPLVIYLHGGSDRGNDLKKLYSQGIPDQTYRGREFPFIVISPQCPEHIRWSTDSWFENLLAEIQSKYRIDINRIYLTGMSMGGSGTWYLAAKYPDTFAAIAPMSGFTSHMDFIDENIDQLMNIPIWAFHGKIDNIVPFEETERIIKKLEGNNREMKFTVEPDVGHWIHWLVYPDQELYDWFLQYDKTNRE